VAEKGIREFAAMATALHGQATFVWVGPDDAAKPDAIAYDLDGVRFLGERFDMESVYNALDLFVLPSYREGFSRSGMEAAASGLPMVLSDIRGCREIGQHDRELLLVPTGDTEALTAAVARLLDDADLRRRLGAAAQARARQHFDQVAVAAASLQTYAQVAQRRSLGWTVETRAIRGVSIA
jgi:glycosyltransferase involved in cell wall biosynthesis